MGSTGKKKIFIFQLYCLKITDWKKNKQKQKHKQKQNPEN